MGALLLGGVRHVPQLRLIPAFGLIVGASAEVDLLIESDVFSAGQ